MPYGYYQHRLEDTPLNNDRGRTLLVGRDPQPLNFLASTRQVFIGRIAPVDLVFANPFWAPD
eukprot:1178685-Prorocentrum_minimum.AAC.6